jgi:hypothetical protein
MFAAKMLRVLTPIVLAALLVPATLHFGHTAAEHLNSSSADHASWRLNALLAVISAAAQYHLLRTFSFRLRERRLGCAPAPTFPLKDPVLGIDLFLETIRAIRAGRFQEVFRSRFSRVAPTYWANTLGSWILVTCEPENIKAILQARFDDWAIAGPRLHAVLPAVGPHSIFSSNGPAWHDSRAMLRPSFVRDQVADLECFDRHIQDLLDSMPRDGSKFDFQKLAMCMTMDSSTDFM